MRAIYFWLVAHRTDEADEPDAEADQAGYGEAEYEEELRRVNIAERWQGLRAKKFNLLRQQILLALTVGLTLLTAYCAARGFRTSIPVVTGGSSLAAGVASLIESRRKPKSDD
jgi:hypothetical protein